MKKIIAYILLIAGMISCIDDQEINFPDYLLKAVYFPVQLPIRTLSLGEDRIDNSLDKKLQFDIGVSIGGMYENKKDWTVDFVVDNTLCNNLYIGTSTTPVLALPKSYYSLVPDSRAIIPSGSFDGKIRVQLTDAFLDDPIAIRGEYVIPLRLTGTSADSILSGKPAEGLVRAPDRRINSDWQAGKLPKDWVLYGIKYVNPYHGTYLQRGKNIKYKDGVPVETVVYHQRFVEQDQLVKFTTTAKNKIETSGISNVLSSGNNKYAMELNFNNITGASGDITIAPSAGSIYSVTGTGKYFAKADSKEGYSGLILQSMHLNYSYTEGEFTHQVVDTLVFRDRGIVYQELSVVVK